MLVHPGQTMLSAYHDGELDSAGAHAVGEHLRVCDDCRQDHQALATTANAVRHWPRRDAPPSLAGSIRGRIDTEVHGNVPILRGQILSESGRPGFVSALALGTLMTLMGLGLMVALNQLAETAAQQLRTAWLPGPVAPPVMLHGPISKPRFRHGYVEQFLVDEVGLGKEGTVLTLASIDQHGSVRGIEVIDQHGDAVTLNHALDVVRASGFEPARLGNQTIPVNFLYLFTATEVRST